MITPPVTVHDFWTIEGRNRQNEQIHFQKSVGLIGGTLIFLASPSTEVPTAIGVSQVVGPVAFTLAGGAFGYRSTPVGAGIAATPFAAVIALVSLGSW